MSHNFFRTKRDEDRMTASVQLHVSIFQSSENKITILF